MFFSRRRFVGLAALFTGAVRFGGASPLAANSPLDAKASKELSNPDLKLWFEQPSVYWQDALPIGNGRLGGMVFGGVKSERIALNEDTLWSGQPGEWNNPGAKAALPVVRKLVLEDKDYLAADLECHKMMGPWNQAYEPLGDLTLNFEHGMDTTSYRRELDLDSAVARVIYETGGVRYLREVFASLPDNVLVVRLSASKPGALTLTAKLSSPLHSESESNKAGSAAKIVLTGKAPSQSKPEYLGDVPGAIEYSPEDGKGMHFAAVLHAKLEGGTVAANPDGSLSIENATSVLLTLGAATGYRGFAVAPAAPLAEVLATAEAAPATAQSKSYESLIERHMEDHRRLFRRVSLQLGPAPAASPRPTDKRVIGFAAQPDPALLALVFHYGRYLLIASSRVGTQPANLQGIWSAPVRPPWSCNWTSNINVQMNYWGAETCNLSECHLPLIEMVRDLSVNGAVTAKTNYGASGWVSHHNIDLWRQSGPAGDYGVAWANPTWANYCMSGGWLCQHLWEHYAFTGDRQYLRQTAYPVMKGCAEFCLDWLIDDGNGGLTTCPSVSTENIFKTASGKPAAVSAGCTHDIAVITEVFTNCIAACGILGVDAAFAATLKTMLKRMPPYKIGRYGQLQEWSIDFVEEVPGMRHMSHLYPLYPGGQITPLATPELAQAARASLERRLKFAAIDGTFTGWGRAWAIGLWARLGDGDMAWDSLKMLINHSLSINLFDNVNDTNPKSVPGQNPSTPDFVFEIDANFGGPAAIAEMLLQSHEGEIAILPAWPASWTEGKVTGLKARGGAEVDIAWKSLSAADVTLQSAVGKELRLRAPKGHRFRSAARERDGRSVAMKLPPGDAQTFTFPAVAGETYRFTVGNA
jgi:alpha-L-fucosidase 2